MFKKYFLIFLCLLTFCSASFAAKLDELNFLRSMEKCSPYEDYYTSQFYTGTALKRRIYGIYNNKCLYRERAFITSDPRNVGKPIDKKGLNIRTGVMECQFPLNMLNSVSVFYMNLGRIGGGINDSAAHNYSPSVIYPFSNPFASAFENGVCTFTPTEQIIYIAFPLNSQQKQ